MYNYVTLHITFFFCQTTVYFVSLRKGPWLMAGSSVYFVKNSHRTYSYRKFLSHLNIQGIQDPFNKFPLHSCKVKAISLYFWFCFLLLFIQFHCHKKCKNGSKQNELEDENKPSFCSLLVRKACKRRRLLWLGFMI